MGAAYFLVVEGDTTRQTMLDGKALATDFDAIERLATKHGLKTPDDYFSQSPDEAIASMADIMGVEVEELSDEEIAAARQGAADIWFDPAEGITFTARLIELIENDPSQVDNPEGVLLDLKAMQDDLTQLQSENKRWRFAVDF